MRPKAPSPGFPTKCCSNIMKHADNVSLLCLKRTCHTILRLFCTETQVLRLWDRRFDTHYPRFHTPRCGVEKVPEAARESLQSLLQRDMYCRMCRGPGIEARTKKLQDERLRCSGRKREHPAGMFSFNQRRIVLNIAEYVSDEKATCQPVATRQSPGTSSSIFWCRASTL